MAWIAKRWMVFVVVCLWGMSCAPSHQVAEPADRTSNLACNPWRIPQLYDALRGRSLQKLTGCLVVKRGETAQTSAVAQLTEQGELWGWDGEQFTSAVGISLAIPPGVSSDTVSFAFYAYADQQALPKAIASGFCASLSAGSPLACLSEKEQSCLFALSFVPSQIGTSTEQPVLLEGGAAFAQYDGGGCRLLAAPYTLPIAREFDVEQEAGVSSACDGCLLELFASRRSTLPVQRELAYAVAHSPDGRFLVAAYGGDAQPFRLHVYEADATSGLYTKEVRSFSTSKSKPFRLRFSPQGTLLAVIKEKEVEIFDVGAFLLSDPIKTSFVFRLPKGYEDGVTADLVFVRGDLIAVAFFESTEKGLVQLYALEQGNVARLVLERGVGGSQALAVGPKGDWLFVAGRVADGARFKPQMHGFRLGGSVREGSLRFLEEARSAILNLPGTNITTLEMSPDGRYLAGGTSPDTKVLRGPLGTQDAGVHGHVLLWNARKMELARSFYARVEGGGEVVYTGGFTKRVHFSSDGAWLVSIGCSSSVAGASSLHVWERLDQAIQPFGLHETVIYGKPAFDVAFGAGCVHLFVAAGAAQDKSSEPLTMWRGCVL